MDIREIYLVLCFVVQFFSHASLEDKVTTTEKPLEKDEGVKYPKGVPCKIYDLQIIDCDKRLSRFGNDFIRASYKKTCNLREKHLVFHYGVDDKYSFSVETPDHVLTVEAMREAIHKKKLRFKAGVHSIRAELSAISMKFVDLHIESAPCTFTIITENATANLGRVNRNVLENRSFKVDASKSMNNDLEKYRVGLQYRWNCTDNVGFCKGKKLGNGVSITVDKKYAKRGAKFKFTVEVKTAATSWQKAVQFVNVNNSLPFSINCVRFCGKEPNVWNPVTGVTLMANCQFNCRNYNLSKINGYLRYIDKKRKDSLISDLALEPKLLRAVLAKSRMKVLAFYEDHNKRSLVGEQDFTSFALPKLEKCKVIPPHGTPLTKYHVNCTYNKEEVHVFELLIYADNSVTYSDYREVLEDFEFSLPRHSTVKISLRDKNDVMVSQKIPVKVDPIVQEKNLSVAYEKLMDVLHGKVQGAKDIDKLLEQAAYSEAFQCINIVAHEWSAVKIRNDKDNEIATKVKRVLLDYIDQIPNGGIYSCRSLSSALSLISSMESNNTPDSKMAKIISNLCNRMSKHLLYLKKNDLQDLITQNDIQGVASNLMECGEQEIFPYYSLFNETSIEIELTTRYPIREELSENDVEEYPEYFSDDLIEKDSNQFIEAAETVIDICRDLGKSLVLSTSIFDEIPTYIERESMSIGVFKSIGSKIAGTVFRQHNVTVKVTPFLRRVRGFLAVQLCTYKTNPFWSSTQHKFEINTNVLEMTVSDIVFNKEYKDFGTEPMNMALGVSTYTRNHTSGVIDFRHFNPSKYPEDNFNIITVKSKSLEAFFIEFYDIGKSDHIQVVITEMERPQLFHFSNAKIITKENHRLLINHVSKDDQWFLIGIVPKERNSSTTSLRYTVYSVSCVEWDFNTTRWKISCPVHMSTTPEIIHCECTHLSTIAGSFRLNDARQLPRFAEIHFIIRKTKSLFIPLFMLGALGLYFFLLVYAIQKIETREDAVYFLSDVPAHNRYSYLISIRTGRKLDSGTTSDIMIQIFGTEGRSQEHTLNFPDPFLELLQTNQTDLFVLATSHYLGKLSRIRLWFDCTGSSPNWYCGEIAICDLQTKVWFVFKVNKWLRVDGKPRLFLDVVASSEHDEGRSENIVKKQLKNINMGSLKNTIWSPWSKNYNPSFGLTKRLTLILSILLTLMGTTLILYGLPELMARDSITPNLHYDLNWDEVYIGLKSAAITFFPHFLLMQGFKNSRLQFDDAASNRSRKMPFCFTWMIWIIICVNVIAQIHLLTVYGFWVVFPITWEWATSLLIAMVFYIFILEGIFQMILESIGSVMDRSKLNYDKIIQNVERQRQYLYSKFGKLIYRPILKPFYRVMAYADYMIDCDTRMKWLLLCIYIDLMLTFFTNVTILNLVDHLIKYLHFIQKREVLWQLQDLFMIVFFLSFMYIIIMEERNTTYDVLGYEEAILLLNGHKHEKNTLEKVNKINEFEDYMQHTLIPNIQSYEWYGKYVSRSPGSTTDVCNKYLGIIRIRQHRVEDSQCNVTSMMAFINRTCRTISYYPHLNFLNFTPAWTETIPQYYPTRLGYVWGYNATTGESYFGVSGHYKKGGYVALLGRTEKNSLVNFDYLRRYYWMDILTRIIFIEFTFYNVNTNLFNFATVILEKTPAGYIHKEAFVQSARIAESASTATVISLIFSIFFIILIALITFRTIVRIIRTKVWYKRDLWHFVDVGIISLSITWIVLYIRRDSILKSFIRELEEKRSNTFLDYFDMLAVESWIKILAGILICVITIRIWRLLRFANVFRVVERTLAYSFVPLVYCWAYFFIACVASGIMAYVIFCSSSDNFKDGISTAKTLILMTIGLRGPNTLSLEEKNTSLGYTFIVLFYMLSYFFTTIQISILIVSFIKAQQFAFEEKLDYNVKDYTHETMKNVRRMAKMWVRKFRLKAGAQNRDDKEMVWPKDNDVRYMNCHSVDSNRMKAMASVARCVIRRRQKGLLLNQSDHSLMMQTVRDLCNKKDGVTELFFKQDTKSGGCVFVDDRRILMIEDIVKRMLESPEQLAARMRNLEDQESLRAENLAHLQMLNYRLKILLQAVEDIEIELQERSAKNI